MTRQGTMNTDAKDPKNKKKLMNLGQFETELFCDDTLAKLSKCIELNIG